MAINIIGDLFNYLSYNFKIVIIYQRIILQTEL